MVFQPSAASQLKHGVPAAVFCMPEVVSRESPRSNLPMSLKTRLSMNEQKITLLNMLVTCYPWVPEHLHLTHPELMLHVFTLPHQTFHPLHQ
jgi:hypothetical protein